MASNPRYANGARRRALRNRILHRDDTCWLCHAPVDKTLPAGHPQAGEVHEIVPVSRGGSPLDANNCTLTHRRCNQWIGDRLPSELVGTGSRRRGRISGSPKPVNTSRQW